MPKVVELEEFVGCDWPQDRTRLKQESKKLQNTWKDLSPDTPVTLFAVLFNQQREATSVVLSVEFRLSNVGHGDFSNYRLSRYFGAPVVLTNGEKPEMRMMNIIYSRPKHLRDFVAYGYFTRRHIDSETVRASVEIPIIHSENKNEIMTEKQYLDFREKSAQELKITLNQRDAVQAELDDAIAQAIQDSKKGPVN